MIQRNATGTPRMSDGRRKRKNDLIFITALLVILTLSGLAFFLCREEGDVVAVEIDGKEYGTYTLSEDRTIEIRTGENGEELNRLVIRDGKAFVEIATCPDGICAAHKPISREGESIVCLPHRVVITVRISHSGDGTPDVVV